MLQSVPEENPDARCLITFEIPIEPPYWGGAYVKKLELHRAKYLDYSGDIGGDKGSVERMDSGNLDWVSQKEEELIFSLRFENPIYQNNSGLWRFTQLPDHALWHAEHLSDTQTGADTPE
jgi:hypothetical protein